MRGKIGARRHVAQVRAHDGSTDNTGQPVPDAYTTTVIAGWPCEILTTAGGERIRGRQVSASTTHVFFGEYFGALGAMPAMRMYVDGREYSIVAVMDPDGDSHEMRIEARRDDL